MDRLDHYRECLRKLSEARSQRDLMLSGQCYMDATVHAILASITDLTRLTFADDLMHPEDRE